MFLLALKDWHSQMWKWLKFGESTVNACFSEDGQPRKKV